MSEELKMQTDVVLRKMGAILLKVSRKSGKAIVDYQMIQEGDKVAVAVSGGKDSRSLLHILRDRQRISPVHFDFTAVHVDFGFDDFDPSSLVGYFKENNFKYIIEKTGTIKDKSYAQIDCFEWSRARRKALFELASKQGFTKIAFGHHMDDIAETILLNQFYRGEVGAMRPKQELFNGEITIIRPLAYVREKEMVELSKELKIHGMAQSKCASDDTSHRMRIKNILKQFEQENPHVVNNIFKSLQNVREDYLLDIVDINDSCEEKLR